MSSALFSVILRNRSALWGGALIGLGLTPGSSLTQLKTNKGDVYTINSSYHLRLKANFLYQTEGRGTFLVGLASTVDRNGFSPGSTVAVSQTGMTLYSAKLLGRLKFNDFDFDVFGGYAKRMIVSINSSATAINATAVGALEYGASLDLKIVNSVKASSGLFFGFTQTNKSSDNQLVSGTGINFGSFFYRGASTQFQLKPYIELNSYKTNTGSQAQAIYGLHFGLEIPTFTRHIQYETFGR